MNRNDTSAFNNIHFRIAVPQDADSLFQYLTHLSAESRMRFGPHAFDLQTIKIILENKEQSFLPFVAEDLSQQEIIAWFLIRKGWIPGDAPRFQSCNLVCNESTDCTFAPSVADAWQNKGLGSWLFKQLKSMLKEQGFQRVFLWGGVQSGNSRAIRFYEKKGFCIFHVFEYYGRNFDMMLERL